MMQKEVKEVFNDYSELNNIRDCIITNVNLFKKSNKLEIYLTSNKQIKVSELENFEDFLVNKFAINKAIIEVSYAEGTEIEDSISADWQDLVKYMSEYISSDYDCYVINDGDRLQPLCAIYSKKLLPLIEKLINENKYKLFEIISNSRTKVIDLEYSKFDKQIVKNINTKDDYFEIIKPIVFAVSGYKNSGKTFMIEKLINEFINDGYSVATIKHDGHDVIDDAKDTDTYKFSKAGAKVSAALTDTRYFINDKRPVDVDELIDRISSEDSPDIIILEGFKNSKFPKVEMIRKEVSDKSIVDKSNLICIATDLDSLEGKYVFNINDISGIFLCIKDYFKSE